jgi:glycosyltransferase 2 family protein
MGHEGPVSNIWLRRGRQVFSLAMLAILVWVVVTGASQIAWADWMWLRMTLAGLVAFGGLIAAAASWAAVIQSNLNTGVATMGTTMPLRHLPLGSFGQVVGMAGLAKVATRGGSVMSYAMPATVAVTAAGGAIVAAPAAFLDSTPLWLKALLASAAVFAVVLAWKGDGLLRWGLRRMGRPTDRVPRSWLVPIAWSALAAIATSASFAILSPQLSDPLTSAIAFAAAWLSGYLFVIAPAGVGVREGVLVMMLGTPAAASVVVTAFAHRFATLVGEAALFIIAWRQGRQLENGQTNEEVVG